VILGTIFYYEKYWRRIGLDELRYSSCIYPREAEKHDNSDGFGRYNNGTFNDSDMYHHHHRHRSCGVIK
jgi:hypothetical protein